MRFNLGGNMNKQFKADFALLLITIGWGSSFLLSKNALADLETFNFLWVRFLMAFIVSATIFNKKMRQVDRKTLNLGIFMGVILFAHYALQTIGLTITTVSKSAFITGTNVVMVPIFSAVLIKRMPQKSAVVGVTLAFLGMGLLTLNSGEFGINLGDVLTLLCAAVFALYIILVGKYTVEVDSVSFAVIQIGVVGILSLITSYLFEVPHLPSSVTSWLNIGFLAVACTSIAFIVQSVAQQYTSPTHTALIYSGEPVFAAMFAFVIAHEVLGPRGLMGAGLILSGMLVAELDLSKLFIKKKDVTYDQA
jgi:drug/metabolite transporter (DMT)-like permease